MFFVLSFTQTYPIGYITAYNCFFDLQCECQILQAHYTFLHISKILAVRNRFKGCEQCGPCHTNLPFHTRSQGQSHCLYISSGHNAQALDQVGDRTYFNKTLLPSRWPMWFRISCPRIFTIMSCMSLFSSDLTPLYKSYWDAIKKETNQQPHNIKDFLSMVLSCFPWKRINHQIMVFGVVSSEDDMPPHFFSEVLKAEH